MSILNSDSPKQSKADNDESFATAARDMVETVSEVGFPDESENRLKLLAKIVLT